MAGNDVMAGVEIVQFNPRAVEATEEVAQIIEISARESMVPITSDSIRFHHLSQVARVTDARGQEQFAGYGAITHIYSPDTLEIGGLLVPYAYRGMGIASALVRRLVTITHEVFEPSRILAFTNQASSSIFEKMGGEQIADPDMLPAEVYKVCHACVNYQEQVVRLGNRCCGRIFDITNIDTHE